MCRGHVFGGALLGMALGPLGWLFAVLADSRNRCPLCREAVQQEAQICKSCGVKLAWSEGKPFEYRKAETDAEPGGDWESERRFSKLMYGDGPSADEFNAMIDETLGKPAIK
jgi:hypothetical protein